jgi:hypothetical protein
MLNNIDGIDNIAFGADSLRNNTSGIRNLALGTSALRANTTGNSNVAAGNGALVANTTGSANMALGAGALAADTTGHDNAGIGSQALQATTTGTSNVGIGSGAGANLTTGNNNIDIANPGVAGEAGRIRIGTNGKQTTAFMAGINGVSIAGPTQPVLVNASGQLGTATASSAALKTDIRPLNPGRLLDLRPVSYRYKAAYAPLGDTGTQYGLIAEQVAKQFPALVQRDAHGKPAGVYYQQLPVLLLAKVQGQQKRIDALEAQNRRREAQNRRQQAQIDWLMRHARHHR